MHFLKFVDKINENSFLKFTRSLFCQLAPQRGTPCTRYTLTGPEIILKIEKLKEALGKSYSIGYKDVRIFIIIGYICLYIFGPVKVARSLNERRNTCVHCWKMVYICGVHRCSLEECTSEGIL